jgi:hypothetical protein
LGFVPQPNLPKLAIVLYKHRRWPRASSQIEKRNSEKANPPEVDKYRLWNPPPADCKQGITNIEVRYSIIIIFEKD